MVLLRFEHAPANKVHGAYLVASEQDLALAIDELTDPSDLLYATTVEGVILGDNGVISHIPEAELGNPDSAFCVANYEKLYGKDYEDKEDNSPIWIPLL